MSSLPTKFREELYREFNFDKEFNTESCLMQSWSGRIFVCIPPPFKKGIVELFVNKALKREADVCVLLLPSDTSTEWFHTVMAQVIDEDTNIRFIKGRLQWGSERNKSRVPSLLLILRK